MSSGHHEYLKINKEGLNEYNTAKEHTEQARLNAERAKFSGKRFEDCIEEIRHEADEIVARIRTSFEGDLIRSRSQKVVERYISLISTTQGQIYRQASFDFEVARLEKDKKGFQVVYNRERFKRDPSVSVRGELAQELDNIPEFWDKLGSECSALFNSQPTLGTQFFKVIDHLLLQKNNTRKEAWGTYVSILQGYERLNGYRMNLLTHEPSQTMDELWDELFALTSAGDVLVHACTLIRGIVNNQPRGENSKPAYGDIGDLVTRGKFPSDLDHEYRSAIQSAVSRFGTLFGYPDAASDETYRFLIGVPNGVGDRRNAIYHGHQPHSST
ncbi:hypothetical protein JCM5350_001243 [Sporobolomyces pararoseus]